jgi:thiamine biosynthesis lipoprotein
MPKTSTDLVRQALNGPTMGTRWSALFYASAGLDSERVQAALQAAVTEVDRQMSTWRVDSDLMRLNAAPVDEWVSVPEQLMDVLRLALEIGRASGGTFDIGIGDAVAAWGFGTHSADPVDIRTALEMRRKPAFECLDLELQTLRARKSASVALDLNGIAKGYGVDRLAETLEDFGITSALVGIDGEMRALGARPDGEPWVIAVEAPDAARRAPQSIVALQDAAVATSGDYRHWVEVQGGRLSHTMDPRRGAPLLNAPASVTVVARTSAEADAWATALMVMGRLKGAEFARKNGLNALFIEREGVGFLPTPVGPLFERCSIDMPAA